MSTAAHLARDGKYVSTTLLEQLQDRDHPWNQVEEISYNESDEGEDPDATRNVDELIDFVQWGKMFCAKKGFSTAVCCMTA